MLSFGFGWLFFFIRVVGFFSFFFGMLGFCGVLAIDIVGRIVFLWFLVFGGYVFGVRLSFTGREFEVVIRIYCVFFFVFGYSV